MPTTPNHHFTLNNVPAPRSASKTCTPSTMTEAIEELLKWATSHGTKLNGITPKALPGRGIGIVATRKIQVRLLPCTHIHAMCVTYTSQVGETILKVPTTILRTLGNTPKPVVDKLRGTTVHAILAVGLCLDAAPDLAIWRAVFPSQADLATAMPICWPPELQDLLPAAAKVLLVKQTANFDKDWAQVSTSYPDILRSDFLYAWLLVLTRTFYHVTSRTATLAKTEHMVLQPVADLFNHSPDGCTGSFRADAFAITAWRAYEPGEEVFIRYGAHLQRHPPRRVRLHAGPAPQHLGRDLPGRLRLPPVLRGAAEPAGRGALLGSL